jgi:two-component system cell cycle sensor histidine kinase PleC
MKNSELADDLEHELRFDVDAVAYSDDNQSMWEDKENVQCQRDLLALFVKNQLQVSMALPILAIVFAVTNLLWISVAASFSWLASVFAVSAVQLLICKLYQNSDNGGVHKTKEWVGMLAASEFFFAICWSLPLYLFWDAGSTAQHAFIIAILMAVIAVRIMIANNYLPVIIAGTGVITFAIVIRCTYEAQPLYVGLGTMAFLTEIFFIQLARSLQKTASKMLIFKSQRETLISELEVARMEAEKGRRNAEVANAAKSQFLATMSHELRTPLNAILGFSEILNEELMGPHSNPVYKEYSGDIHESGHYLLHLINDILDLSRIEAGKHKVKEDPVELANVFDDCLKLLRHKFKQRGQTLEVTLPDELPKLKGDERSICQMMINLLSNANKFSDFGTCVEIGAKLLPNNALALYVSDQGQGMSRVEIENVQGVFNRGEEADRKAIEGSGLGLPIVKGLIQLHEGELRIKSEPGKGTTVSVVFPPKRVLSLGQEMVISSLATARPTQKALVALTA